MMRSPMHAALIALALLAPAIALAPSTARAQEGLGEDVEPEAVGGPDYEEQAVGADSFGMDEAVEAHGTAQHDEGASGPSHGDTEHETDHGAAGIEGDHAGEMHTTAAGDHGEHGDHGEEGHGAGAHGDGHDTSINTLELAGSFVNFGIWLALLVLMLRKPLSEFLRNRRASVVEGMEEAKRVKEEAEAKHKEYSERIENLDAELERLREEMRRAGQEERERIVAAANEKAAKMREEARFLVDQQMKQLRVDLTREAVEAAVQTAEALLAKQTTVSDQERLANDYLATLKASLKQKIEEKRL